MGLRVSEWGMESSSDFSWLRRVRPVHRKRKVNQQNKSKVGGLSFPHKCGLTWCKPQPLLGRLCRRRAPFGTLVAKITCECEPSHRKIGAEAE